MRAFRFWYFGEVFILLQLTGLTHSSWWWAALFYAVDLQEGIAYYRTDGKKVAQ
jgi:hypothetical protein